MSEDGGFACMQCGEDCETTEDVEVVPGEWEIWAYCRKCKVETFHPYPEGWGRHGKSGAGTV